MGHLVAFVQKGVRQSKNKPLRYRKKELQLLIICTSYLKKKRKKLNCTNPALTSSPSQSVFSCLKMNYVHCGNLNGREVQKEGISVCVRLIHFVVQWRLTQHCKATILQ